MVTNEKNGMLYVISGPSGVGKGTVIKELLKDNNDLLLSVSVTTRNPREGEIDGIDYFFVERPEFEAKVKNGEFLEWAEVHGEFYGTLKKNIEDNINNGRNIILEIDTKGARQVIKTDYPKKTIFIMPPSEEELITRLKKRNTDTEEAIDIRLNQAKKEMEEKDKYNFVVENKNIKETARKILEIIKAN